MHIGCLSYTCTTERTESECYLNKWIEEIKSHHRVSITHNIERSKDAELYRKIIINFEECYSQP